MLPSAMIRAKLEAVELDQSVWPDVPLVITSVEKLLCSKYLQKFLQSLIDVLTSAVTLNTVGAIQAASGGVKNLIYPICP